MRLQIIILTVLVVVSCTAKHLVPPSQQDKPKTSQGDPSTATTKRSFTCACEDLSEPLCANNGVTYQNMCKFECAKHKVARLRVVKDGGCGKNMTKFQFWSSG